ncbi:acetate/propionate family kinase [Carnimonas nigrificans]|uniref:acetate/propionate family kinase n=1 Tax=Carnimonas nigrificans TaxID=64323 RepID=UPI00047015FD|nr:acetate/propionate family kinase [Carnimonas nigrificans]
MSAGSSQVPAIIVVNAGSSSLKLSIFAVTEDTPPALLLHGELSGIATQHPVLSISDSQGATLDTERFEAHQVTSHSDAYQRMRAALSRKSDEFSPIAVGHRVVHGGVFYEGPVVIDAEVKATIQQLTELAPLHQPPALSGINAVEEQAPDILQVAGFDTSFHFHRDPLTQLTGLPYHFYEQGLRRFGFHGLSYEYIAQQLACHNPELAEQRIVVAHLGAGASLCAMQGGRSINTTMSLTPLDGLPMGTRCGALDPGLMLYLLKQGTSIDELRELLYYDSGLKGLSGVSSDMRELLEDDSPRSRRAVDFFTFRVAEEFGRMAVSLGGVDALIFTGGIGEHSAAIRSAVCERLAPLFDTRLDQAANNAPSPQHISSADSRCQVLVMPTDEEGMLARHVWKFWQQHH